MRVPTFSLVAVVATSLVLGARMAVAAPTLQSSGAQSSAPPANIARAQNAAVSLTDGALVVGAIDAVGGGAVSLRAGADRLSWPTDKVLAIHGAVPRARGAVTAYLVGGDELRGELRGGDIAGEAFTIESRSLGNVNVPVDRLRALVVHALAGDAEVGEFGLPDAGEHDEAVFLPARRGFDTVFGAIHRFTLDGVTFQAAAGNAPQAFRIDKIAAIALRGGRPPGRTPGGVLVTRAGDVLAADIAKADADNVELVDERDRHFTLPWGEVATFLFRGADRVFASELVPERVAEAAALASDGAPLFRWRADRNVSNGFLVVGERAYARGLGVHSHSELTFVVPEGCTGFCAAVGIDDEVRALPARGVVDVAVLLDGEVLAERKGVRAGAPAVGFGCLPVRGGAKLTLRADFGDGLDIGDRVDWLHAVLLRGK